MILISIYMLYIHTRLMRFLSEVRITARPVLGCVTRAASVRKLGYSFLLSILLPCRLPNGCNHCKHNTLKVMAIDRPTPSV